MPNQTLDSTFATSREDLSKLKETAIDAAKDLGSTASVHLEKARSQAKDLAAHAQQEGAQQLDVMKDKFSDLACAARNYVSARPLAVVGTALAIGFLIGLSRRAVLSRA